MFNCDDEDLAFLDKHNIEYFAEDFIFAENKIISFFVEKIKFLRCFIFIL